MLRKLSYVALLLLIGLGACRKKQFEELKQTNNKDAKAIEQSSVWFDDQKLASLKPLSTARGTTIDSIPFHPVWEVAITHQLADNNKLVLAPVWRYANVKYTQQGFLRLLVIRLNSSDEIIAGNIVEIIAEKSYLKQNQQDIMKWYFEGNMRDFTGDILFHALTRNLDFQMGKRYANGQFVSDVKIYKFNIAPNTNQRSDSPECPNPPCDDTGSTGGENQSRAGEMVSIPIPVDQLSSTLSNAVILAGQLANQNIASVVSTNPPPAGGGGGYVPPATPMPNNYIWFYGNNWGGIGNTTNPNNGGQPIDPNTGIDYGMGNTDITIDNYPGKDNGFPYQWWTDEEWLDDNFNLSLDTPQEGGRLTAREKALIAMFPVQAYFISRNIAPAQAETVNIYGSNGLNDRSDAFRHSYFSALNAREVGVFFARLFGEAHESEVPSQLDLEKQMDLHNNEQGYTAYSQNSSFFSAPPSNEVLSAACREKDLTGLLVYLNPLSTTMDPFDYDNNPTGTNNIIPGTTVLIPSDR